MVLSLMSFVHSELKHHAYLCDSIMMSVINACHLHTAFVGSKNSVASISTTGILHKLTGKIVYLYWKHLVTNQ